MSKYKTVKVWNKVFGNRETVFDYAGREMRKSACGDPHSAYHPTLDHTSVRCRSAAVMLQEISSFAIVIPTQKKRINSRIGKQTASCFAQIA